MPDSFAHLRDPSETNIDRLANRLAWLVLLVAVAFGLVWRARQFGAQFSFSVDELAIARNITDRTIGGLFQRLEFGQIAPIGFLLALKTSASLFGASEWSLRLLPFVSGLVTIPLFWVVARRTLLDSGAAAAATALVALATPLALWSAALKQYSLDVLAVLAVIAMSQWILERELRRSDLLRAVGLGVIAALCSQAVAFAIAASAAVLLADAVDRRRRAEFTSRAIVVAAWAIVSAGTLLWSYAVALPADRLYVRKFWNTQFMPWQAGAAVPWLWDRMVSMFSGSPWPNGELQYARPKIWMLLLGIGALVLLIRRPRHALLIVLPVLLTLAASAIQQYPFGGRPSLFLVPLGLLLIVGGAQALGSVAGRSTGTLAAMALVPFAAVPMLQLSPAYHPEHLRPGLQYLSDRLRPTDTIWVYYGAGQAFTYYSRQFPMHAHVILSSCDRTDARATLRQLDAVRGRSRVWIVLTHIDAMEKRALLGYLDAIGTRLDTFSLDARPDAVTASSVFLYRLDDPERLARASAADVPVSPIADPSPWSCYGPMSVLPGSERAAAAALARDLQ